MRTSTALLVLLIACVPDAKRKPEKYVEHKNVAGLTVAVPDGFTAHYNAITDSWRFESPHTTVLFERTPAASTASPEALRQSLGSKAEIESRKGFSDGFQATFVDGGSRDVYVLRQIYNNDWFRCFARVSSVDKAAEIVELCKSLKRPRR